MEMTRRQQLISQLRMALFLMERPARKDDDSIIFEIAETEFEFSVEALDECPTRGGEGE